MGSPLADVLRGFLPQVQQSAGKALSQGAFGGRFQGMGGLGGSAGSAFGQAAPSGGGWGASIAQAIQNGLAQRQAPQPQATLNSGQPGAPAGIGHQFTPTAWTPPSERVYTGQNPNTQLQQLMATQHPMNSAGHTLDWYKQNLGDIDLSNMGINAFTAMDSGKRDQIAQQAYDQGRGLKP